MTNAVCHSGAATLIGTRETALERGFIGLLARLSPIACAFF